MSTPKVLLVDDVKLFLEMEKGILRSSPVRILTAANGAEALRVVDQERPDLVIMDMLMPVMDGVESCRRIKANPLYRSIPVIIVTNSTRSEEVQACRDAGCDELLHKPLNVRQFLDKAHAYLPAIERRRGRVACRASVELKVNGRVFGGTLRDLSVGGLYLETGLHLETGRELEVAFRLPNADANLFIVRGRVAWTNFDRSRDAHLPPGFGIDFIEIVGEGLAAVRLEELKRFVVEQLAPADA